jgi:hypothetical protein
MLQRMGLETDRVCIVNRDDARDSNSPDPVIGNHSIRVQRRDGLDARGLAGREPAGGKRGGQEH